MKKPGFTLIEVLLAMFILISAVYVLSDLQIRSFFRVLSDREMVEATFLAKKNFYAVFSYQPTKIKKIVIKNEEPEVKVVTEGVEISEKSSLKSLKNKLQWIQTEGTWKNAGKICSTRMRGLMVRPEEKEKQ